MHALTYWHPVPGMRDERGLREAWARNWQRLGWQTLELGLREAAVHPRYESFVAKVRTWPSVNLPAYEEACWVRWLALDQWLKVTGEPGAVLCDYDVFDVTATPDMLWSCPAFQEQALVSLDGGLTCLGAVWVSNEFAKIIPALLEDRAMRLAIIAARELRPHTSDLIVFDWLMKRAMVGVRLGWIDLFQEKHLTQLLERRARGNPWLLHLSNDYTTAQNLDRTSLFLEMEQLLWP
jgi:hypothetical protein